MDSVIGTIKKAQPNCMVYGSFKNCQPVSEAHDFAFSDPRRILIKDPSDLTFFEDKYLFMTLETTKDLKITVDVKNDDTPIKKIKRP